MAERKENVVMFPFMAQGHIIPFLALALQIEQRKGYSVTFVNTPLNIKKLRPSLPPNSTINLVELPFCSADHGLPPDSESTDLLPYSLIIRLHEASMSLKSSFTRLISHITHQQDGQPPLCIIADMFFDWTVDVANDHGIFHSVYNSSGAYGMAIYFSIWIHLPQSNTNSDDFLLTDLPEVSRIHRSQLSIFARNATGTDPSTILLQRELRSLLRSDGLLFNTVAKLDSTGLQYFRRKRGRPVWAIGPTRSSSTNRARAGKEAGTNPDYCVEWLDAQLPDSVLYVCFGSQNTISTSQMMELAVGLEGCGKKFIWVVRPPIGFDINSDFRAEEWLPEGFEDRIKVWNKGILVRRWAPQLEILSHKSTCAFLSHCGWNSVIESLSHGVPIIGWPLAAEQFYNSKLLEEEIGVCVEVARGNSDEIRHEHIERVIEVVMGYETQKEKEMRRKVCEVKEMIEDAIRDDDNYKGSSVNALDEFFDIAVSMMKTRRDQKGDV